MYVTSTKKTNNFKKFSRLQKNEENSTNLLNIVMNYLYLIKFLENSKGKNSCWTGHQKVLLFCLSKKSWPILYSNLLDKMGKHFLDIQYTSVVVSSSSSAVGMLGEGRLMYAGRDTLQYFFFKGVFTGYYHIQ